MNTLYFGDNLGVLRKHVFDESVDLVYLDPPFNSKRDYNVIFKEATGALPASQMTAFEDSWHWNDEAARAFDELASGPHSGLAELIQSFQNVLGKRNDVTAYLVMMAPRLIELHRVLKPTGSLYLHCDPTVSHYLKMLLDAVFGATRFQTEIIWKRHNARGTTGRWPRVHDSLLYYTKTDSFTFHPALVQADEAKLPHHLITWKEGKKYQTFELTAPGVTRDGESGKPWRGFDPSTMGRHWANVHSIRDEWEAAGLIHWPKPGKAGGFPRRRAAEPFVSGERMITVGDVWTDIDRINQAAHERMGYNTQKPEALLERIIHASSNEGDVVLDPFCGCGTAVAVAQRLKRQWIGIDVTYLAINLVEYRLKGHNLAKGKDYVVVGEPQDAASALSLAQQDKWQFQFWATAFIGAFPVGGEKKKGSDKGIDGVIPFRDGASKQIKRIIVQVKGGGNISVTDVRDLHGTVEREQAAMGFLLLANEPTKPMRDEAAQAGVFKSENWGTFPKLQIRTVEDLFSGKPFEHPRQAVTGLKAAPKAQQQEQMALANADDDPFAEA